MKGGGAPQREIVPLGVEPGRDARRGQSLDRARHVRRAMPGGVDEEAAREPHRCRAADRQGEPLRFPPRRQKGRLERAHRAERFRIVAQGVKQGGYVDDAGRGGKQGARAGQGRLQPRGGPAREQLRVGDAVGHRRRRDPRQDGILAGRRRHHQFAQEAVRHAMDGGEGGERLPAGDAEPRLQAARRIIQSGVDDAAAAPRRSRAARRRGLDHQDRQAVSRQSPGDREADDARADHDGFHVIHVTSRCPGRSAAPIDLATASLIFLRAELIWMPARQSHYRQVP